jgi:hypothetical protein
LVAVKVVDLVYQTHCFKSLSLTSKRKKKKMMVAPVALNAAFYVRDLVLKYLQSLLMLIEKTWLLEHSSTWMTKESRSCVLCFASQEE